VFLLQSLNIHTIDDGPGAELAWLSGIDPRQLPDSLEPRGVRVGKRIKRKRGAAKSRQTMLAQVAQFSAWAYYSVLIISI